MADQQIPAIAENVGHVALVVVAWRIGRQDVTRPSVMAESGEGIADGAGILAGDKHSHASTPSA